MKKNLLLACTAVGLLASTAAYAITVTGNATATIKAAITATENQTMNFGTISSSTAGATVKMDTAGVRTSTLTFYNTSNAGSFNVTAEPSTVLTITFGNGTLSNGANTMALSNFTHASTPGSDTTDNLGALSLKVGADLAVGANQASGVYNGTYTVTLSY